MKMVLKSYFHFFLFFSITFPAAQPFSRIDWINLRGILNWFQRVFISTQLNKWHYFFQTFNKLNIVFHAAKIKMRSNNNKQKNRSRRSSTPRVYIWNYWNSKKLWLTDGQMTEQIFMPSKNLFSGMERRERKVKLKI